MAADNRGDRGQRGSKHRGDRRRWGRVRPPAADVIADARATAGEIMDIDHPEQDQHWDTRQRRETETERLDRNWASLLQELRVTQTGVQLLTGFLLTLPFQQRFNILTAEMRLVYLATVGASVAATVLLIAPVGMHRLLFRRHRLTVLVPAAHRCAYSGLILLGVALVGVTVIVFDAVAGTTVALIAGAIALSMFALFWLAVPLFMRAGKLPPPAP